MPFNKPPLKDGAINYLSATVADNNGFTPAKFIEIMNYDVNESAKVATIARLSGKGRQSVRGWVRQYAVDNRGGVAE
jgi:hypothetical protein